MISKCFLSKLQIMFGSTSSFMSHLQCRQTRPLFWRMEPNLTPHRHLHHHSSSSSETSQESGVAKPQPQHRVDTVADEIHGALYRNMWHVSNTGNDDESTMVHTACGRKFPEPSCQWWLICSCIWANTCARIRVVIKDGMRLESYKPILGSCGHSDTE